MMIAHSPEHAIELIDKAFQEADIESLVSLYDDSAVLIDSTGTYRKEIRGKKQLGEFYGQFLKPGLFTVKQIKTHVIEADGVALFTSRWSLGSEGSEPKVFICTVVFRKQPNEDWKDLIDSGPVVLDW